MTRRSTGAGQGERGSVTAEFAVALPAVLALAGAAVALGAIATAKVQCVAAATAAARHAIVTENAGEVAAIARQIAGGGAKVAANVGGQWRTVTVSRTVSAAWFDVEVTGRAHAKAEPTWP